jgi:hypothetical protein
VSVQQGRRERNFADELTERTRTRPGEGACGGVGFHAGLDSQGLCLHEVGFPTFVFIGRFSSDILTFVQ